MLQRHGPLAIVTDGGGAFTGYLTPCGNIRGWIVCFKYTHGTLPLGTDVTIYGELSGVPILTIAALAAADAWWYPRSPAILNTTGAAIADSDVDIGAIGLSAGERLVVVVAANNQNVYAGEIEVWTEEPAGIS